MTPCPACNQSVDPLRSRFVGVLDGKIVAYCSAVCAGGSPRSGAVPAAAARAQRAPTPVAVVPRKPTPAAGVPAKPTPASGIPLEISSSSAASAASAAAAAMPASFDSGPVIEIIREPTSGTVASGAVSNGTVAAVADERSAPRVKHPDEISIGEFWSTDRQKAAASPDGAAPPRARPGPVSTLREHTVDAAVGEASRPGSDSEDAIAPRRSRLAVVLLIVALVAGGGLVVYRYVLRGKVAAANHAPDARAAASATAASAVIEPAPAAAPPPPVDSATALTEARATLRADLSATSQRIQRVAATALARTGDPAAREVLAAQLGLDTHRGSAGSGPSTSAASSDATLGPASPLETSDIARLDLAYSLARGGDSRGAEALVAALGSPRGEARDEAARLLAQLGDARAAPHLIDLLAVSQRRLGAAEHLAHLAEPHAIKVLLQIRGDARASSDDKARAAIALGNAGHGDVAPALRDMLGDPHVNAFAAAALAELRDSAARPVLERQLESPALRVRSARALRRLDPALDVAGVLPHLLALLHDGRDTDQVQAAEAILLLAGPAHWSAYE